MHEKFGNTPKIRLERELRGDLSVPKAELPASVKSHATPNLRDYTTWKLVPMEPPKEKPVSEWALEPMEPPKESPVIMDTFSPLPSDNFAPELSSIPNTTSVIPSVTPATPHSFNTPTLSAYDAGGEQRIVNVEKDVGLSSEDIIDVRKGFGLLARIRDIKNKADGLFRIFVKNFSGLQGRGKVPDIQIKRTVVESPEYIELTEFLNFTHR